jgi:hypothetical protein
VTAPGGRLVDADTLVVVHGHREGHAGGGRRRISSECHARVRAAECAVAKHRAAHVLFCGATEPGLPSEAAQMSRAWAGPPVFHWLDEISLDSAQNAQEAHRWARKLGVTRVIVVSSWWHIRLALYYRPLRDGGIAVRHAPAWRCHGIVRHLAHELRYLPEAILRLRAAKREARLNEAIPTLIPDAPAISTLAADDRSPAQALHR